MQLTRDYIINHIKTTKFPLWTLSVIQNYKKIPLMNYIGDDFSENESTEGKIEKSISRLLAVLSDFPSDALLAIELKSSRSANQGGVVGPIEFVNKNREEVNESAKEEPQNPFAGFAAPPAGFVSEAYLNARLEAIRAENQQFVNNLIFKQKEKDFEERKKRELKEIEEMRKELKDERKKYDSNIGAASEALVFAGKKILGELFPAFNAISSNQAALEGAPEQTATPEPQTTPEQSAKYQAVSRLATMLYESPNVTEAQINGLTKSIESNLTNTKEEEKKDGICENQ